MHFKNAAETLVKVSFLKDGLHLYYKNFRFKRKSLPSKLFYIKVFFKRMICACIIIG